MNHCPRCENGEISMQDNFCKICGLLLNEECIHKTVQEELDREEAAAEATALKKCCMCNELGAGLELDDGILICETCAQIQSDLGHELSIED